MVKAGASEFRGAYYSHGKQFIENLPVRQIDFTDKAQVKQYNEVVKTVEQLIAAKQGYNQVYLGARKRVFERKIDFLFDKLVALINKLYGISDDEMNIVLNDEMFLTDLNED